MTDYTDSAKRDILRQALIDNRYTDVIDRLRPNSTISINPSQKGFHLYDRANDCYIYYDFQDQVLNQNKVFF